MKLGSGFSRGQKVLLGMIGVELLLLAGQASWHATSRPAPRVNLARFDPSYAQDIARMVESSNLETAEDWVALADYLRSFGLFPDAEYCFRQADELSPQDAGYLYLWGVTLDRLGRLTEAEAMYRRALEAGTPEKSRVWFRLGQLLLRMERPAEAETALRQSGLPRAKLRLCRVLIRTARAEEASALLDDVLARHPRSLQANLLKACAEEALGRHEAAREYQDRSLRSQPVFWGDEPALANIDRGRQGQPGAEGYHARSIELEQRGQLRDAIGASRAAVELYFHPSYARRLAQLELQAKNPAAVFPLMRRSLQTGGVDAGALEILGDAHAATAANAKARAAWRQAVQIYPSAQLYRKLAENCRRSGLADEARQYEAFWHYELGKAAWLNDNLIRAQAELEQSVELSSGHAPSWFYLAETRRVRGQTAGARAAYQRCIEINPDHGRAIRALRQIGDDAGLKRDHE